MDESNEPQEHPPVGSGGPVDGGAPAGQSEAPWAPPAPQAAGPSSSGPRWVPPPPANPWAPPAPPGPEPSWPNAGGWAQPGASGWQPGYGNPYGPPGGYQGGPAYGNPYGDPSWGGQGGGNWGPPRGPEAPPGSSWNYGWHGPGNQPRRTLPGTVTALLVVLAVFVGLGIGHGVWRSTSVSINGTGSGSGLGNSGGSSTPSFGSGGLGSQSPSFNTDPITSIADPGLVDIDTTLTGGEAAGTGIVLSADGYVLTNNHVISGSTSIKATDIGNGQTFTATVVGYDRTQDVAVIKLQDASGLTVAHFASSNNLSVDQNVVGIGNAGGTGGTPSAAAGQITALGQSITAQDESNGTSENLTGLIETNADIQPGDSGGALVNTKGQVIGMDTAASAGFSIQASGNQGFAIPIDEALSIAKVIRSGTSTTVVHIGPTAFLGVEVDISNSSGISGASLASVLSGGPADAAGLAGGDTITALGGTAVKSANDLTNLISQHHPGDRVSVTWIDQSGASHTATVHLATGPAA